MSRGGLVAWLLVGCSLWGSAQGEEAPSAVDPATAPTAASTPGSAPTPTPVAAPDPSAGPSEDAPAATEPALAGLAPMRLPANSVPWQTHIEAAAQTHGVDYLLLHALIDAESGFNASALSRRGAVGLMQIMPQTAAYIGGLIGTRKALRKQLMNPQTNLDIGTRYLSGLLREFEGRFDLALAAYNAGSGNVRKAGYQIPQNRETPNFVNKVLQTYSQLQSALQPTRPALP